MKKTEQDYLEMCYPCPVCKTSKKLFFSFDLLGVRIGCAGCGTFNIEHSQLMQNAVTAHNIDVAEVIDKLRVYLSWELVYELKEELQYTLDLARTGLPLPEYTEEEWAKHRLNQIASELSDMKRKVLKITGV